MHWERMGQVNYYVFVKLILICIVNFVYELAHEWPIDLELRILGNLLRIEKSQNWLEPEPSHQSLLQKPIFGNSSQNLRKSRYQNFA